MKEVKQETFATTSQGVVLAATLKWASPRAVEVTFAFRDGAGLEVRWTFARSLLHEGFLNSGRGVGLGDVNVTVYPERRVVKVRLESPDGLALLTFPLRDVAKFLAVTSVIIPVGSEDLSEAVDDFLATL